MGAGEGLQLEGQETLFRALEVAGDTAAAKKPSRKRRKKKLNVEGGIPETVAGGIPAPRGTKRALQETDFDYIIEVPII